MKILIRLLRGNTNSGSDLLCDYSIKREVL